MFSGSESNGHGHYTRLSNEESNEDHVRFPRTLTLYGQSARPRYSRRFRCFTLPDLLLHDARPSLTGTPSFKLKGSHAFPPGSTAAWGELLVESGVLPKFILIGVLVEVV